MKKTQWIDTCEIVSDLLKEFHTHDIEDSELEKKLENINKADLFNICYFIDLKKKYYQNLYETQKKSELLYLNKQ